MTTRTNKWLASVQSLAEAQALQASPPDIIDLKDPHAGALGAIEIKEISDIVLWARQAGIPSQISATIGDLPMQAAVIAGAIKQTAATGVDYVKIGIFNTENLTACLAGLAPTLHALNTPVIAVLFADDFPPEFNATTLADAGFTGAMVDTATKNGQGLLAHWSTAQCTAFAANCRQASLLCGLAGGLQFKDIAALQPLGADYLGFRSALCDNGIRTAAFNADRAHAIHQLFKDIDTF